LISVWILALVPVGFQGRFSGSALFAAPIAPVPAKSKKEKITRLSLREVVERSLRNARSIKIQEALIRETRWAEKEARLLRNPYLELETGSRTTKSGSGSAFSLSVEQPLFFPGKRRLRRGAARALIGLEKEKLTALRLQLRYRVIILSYRTAILAEKIEHTEERIKRHRLLFSYFRGRPLLSPNLRLKFYLIEEKLKELLNRRDELQARDEKVRARLRFYLLSTGRLRIHAPWFRLGPELKRKELLELALKNNREVRLARSRLRLARARLRLAERAVYPDLRIGARVSRINGPDSESYYALSIKAYLPLFNRNQTGRGRARARLERKSRELQLRILRIKQKMNELFSDYEYARRSIRRFPSHELKKTHARMSYADREFRRGRVDPSVYLETDAQSDEFHDAIFNSQLRFVIAYARLLQFAGSANFQLEVAPK